MPSDPWAVVSARLSGAARLRLNASIRLNDVGLINLVSRLG
jgi:hypothetical protein